MREPRQIFNRRAFYVRGRVTAFLKTGEECFLKIKLHFCSQKRVPAVESNCCVSDEHAFDFYGRKGFFMAR